MEYNIFEELALLCKNSITQEIHTPELYVELNFVNHIQEQQNFFELNSKSLPDNIVLDTKIINATFPNADYLSVEKSNLQTNYKLQITFNFSSWDHSIALKEFVLKFVSNANNQNTDLEIIHMDEYGYCLELNSVENSNLKLGDKVSSLSTKLAELFQQSLV